MPQLTLAYNVGGSTSSGSFQNSKNSYMSNQEWRYDLSDTLMCQVAEDMVRLDKKDVGDHTSRQKDGPHDKGSAPTPMIKSESDMREMASNALSNKSQCTQEAKNSTEVTSPQKPTNWAQTREETANQMTVQEIVKNQK